MRNSRASATILIAALLAEPALIEAEGLLRMTGFEALLRMTG